MDCRPSGSSVHGIFQARILMWVANSYPRGSSRLRDQTGVSCISCISRWILYHSVIWEALENCKWCMHDISTGKDGLIIICWMSEGETSNKRRREISSFQTGLSFPLKFSPDPLSLGLVAFYVLSKLLQVPQLWQPPLWQVSHGVTRCFYFHGSRHSPCLIQLWIAVPGKMLTL